MGGGEKRVGFGSMGRQNCTGYHWRKKKKLKEGARREDTGVRNSESAVAWERRRVGVWEGERGDGMNHS